MNIGDVVTDMFNKKWIIYDVLWREGNYILCVTDFETQKANEVMSLSQVIGIDDKPKNVEWLFIIKRNRTLKVLERHLS